MKSRTQAQFSSPETKFLAIEDPESILQQMEFIGIEAVTDVEVVLAIQYLDPDLEGLETILMEMPSGEVVFLAIQYLDPDFD